MDHKIEELKEHIKECAKYYYPELSTIANTREETELSVLSDHLWEDLHQHAFNDDYYIIGTYKAKQWLGDKAMEIVAYVQTYQKENWGEDQIETFLDEDGSIDYERIVNMYAYCRGQELVSDFIDEWENRYENLDLWLEYECRSAKRYIERDVYRAKQKYATV